MALYGVGRQVDVYSALIHGREGWRLLLRIVPALVGLLTAVVYAAGVRGAGSGGPAAVPLLDRVGAPGAVPDAGAAHQRLRRPGGGGGADRELWAGLLPGAGGGGDAGLYGDHLYTIAVYCGAVGVTRTRYALPAALCADLTGFLAAAWAVRLCFDG